MKKREECANYILRVFFAVNMSRISPVNINRNSSGNIYQSLEPAASVLKTGCLYASLQIEVSVEFCRVRNLG